MKAVEKVEGRIGNSTRLLWTLFSAALLAVTAMGGAIGGAAWRNSMAVSQNRAVIEVLREDFQEIRVEIRLGFDSLRKELKEQRTPQRTP